MHAVSLSLLLMTAVPGGADSSVIVLCEGRVISASGFSIADDGALTVAVAGGADADKSIVVESPALLDASSATEAGGSYPGKTRTVGAIVQLTNGEILRASIVEPDSPGTIRIDSRELGPLRLTLEKVAAIDLGARRSSQSVTGRGPDPPYLLLTNGDVVAGAIKGVTPDAVTIDSEFGEADTDMSRVAAIVLAADPPPADGRSAGQLICVLADGQRWYVDAVASGPTGDKVRLSRGAKPVDVPLAAVRQLVFAGWTVRELITLDPPEVSTTPYLGETVRLQIDDAAHRRPLAIGGRSFVGGITARPRSRVTYGLVAPAAYLVGWAGMDPLRGSAGVCDVRVASNDKVLFSFDGLTARVGPRRIAVPIAGLESIALITDFGADAEIGDCVNWCDLTLIEKKLPVSSSRAG